MEKVKVWVRLKMDVVNGFAQFGDKELKRVNKKVIRRGHTGTECVVQKTRMNSGPGR
ncbi:MAG: hypothetical protein GY757_18770 [bacterium]|nr:hypothetical protein [bacterium]